MSTRYSTYPWHSSQPLIWRLENVLMPFTGYICICNEFSCSDIWQSSKASEAAVSDRRKCKHTKVIPVRSMHTIIVTRSNRYPIIPLKWETLCCNPGWLIRSRSVSGDKAGKSDVWNWQFMVLHALRNANNAKQIIIIVIRLELAIVAGYISNQHWYLST